MRSMSKCVLMQLRHNRWRDLPGLGRMSFGHKNPSWRHAPRLDVSHLCNSIPCLTEHETEAKTNCFLCSACTNMILRYYVLIYGMCQGSFQFAFTKTSNSRFHNCERRNHFKNMAVISGKCSYGTVSASTSEIAEAKCPRIAHFASMALQPLAFEMFEYQMELHLHVGQLQDFQEM